MRVLAVRLGRCNGILPLTSQCQHGLRSCRDSASLCLPMLFYLLCTSRSLAK